MDSIVGRLVSPLLVAGLVAAVGAATLRARAVRTELALALIVAVGVVAGAINVGVRLPPAEVTDWVPVVAVAAVAIGAVPRDRRPLVWLAAYLTLWTLILWVPVQLGAVPVPVLTVPLLAVLATATTAVGAFLPELRPRPPIALLAFVALAGAGVLADTGSLRIAVFATAVGGALAGVAAVGSVPAPVAYGIGVPVLTVAWVGGWAFSGTSLPLALWFGAVAPVAVALCTAWWRAAIAGVLVVAVGAGIVLLGG